MVRNIIGASLVAISDGIGIGRSWSAAMADSARKAQELCGAIWAGVRVVVQVWVGKCTC